MRHNILKSILCLLSFGIAFGIALPKASAKPALYGDQGSLNRRLIQKVVRLHENEIRHCYEVALQKDKTLQGTVTTLFGVRETGIVDKVLIMESTLNNRDVERCIADTIKNWEFYGVYTYGDSTLLIVKYPYTFVSNYKPPTILEHVKLIMNEDDMIMEYYEEPPSSDKVMEILLNDGGIDEK